MRKLIVFNSVTLDGYFTGVDGDISWAHNNSNDPEWDAFVAGNAKGGGILLFGRITYEMMAGYWPTPMAAESYPVVAEKMNNGQKIVVSKTLDKTTWKNTTLIKGNLAEEIRKIKNEPGEDIVILGSGTIVSQLSNEGLIDEYQVVVNPIVLGKGRTMFDRTLSLKLTNTRAFGNGNVLLNYVRQTS
jgi:dihydrofolate reductase